MKFVFTSSQSCSLSAPDKKRPLNLIDFSFGFGSWYDARKEDNFKDDHQRAILEEITTNICYKKSFKIRQKTITNFQKKTTRKNICQATKFPPIYNHLCNKQLLEFQIEEEKLEKT